MVFKNREEAAILLARKLKQYASTKNSVLLAIPRGGIVLGHFLSKDLKIPLDFIFVKKIPHPENEEIAIGAVGPDVAYVDDSAIQSHMIQPEYVDEKIRELKHAIRIKTGTYRKIKVEIKLSNKNVILIDDGIATGHTMIAAIKSIRKQKPKKLIIATPVAPPEIVKILKKKSDEVICLSMPENFMAIGQFYSEFEQVDDAEALQMLKTAYSPKKK